MDTPRLLGLVLVAVGWLAGLVLVAQTFVATIDAATMTMALLFLACLAVGVPLYAGGRQRQQALRLVGGALLLLGVAALLGLFADAAGIYAAVRPTTVLWLLAPLCLAGGLLLAYFAGALDRLGGEAR